VIEPKKLLPYAILAALLLAVMVFSAQQGGRETAADLPYSAFKQQLASGNVDAVAFQGDELIARLREGVAAGDPAMPSGAIRSRIPAFGDPTLLASLEARDVEISVLPAETGGAVEWIGGLLPWLLLIGIYWWMWNRFFRNVTGRLGGRDASDFLAGSAKKEEKGGSRITFKDVAGQENAKREVEELVAFLRDPERYRQLGAEPPRGVLLVGPPGTGKTLLARALAGEAGVPFFHISASELIEMFVGVGASRVRKMFDEAKKRAPAIIFIDELDSVGRVRGAGLGGGHDEREQTLNQILAEMDGFSGHEAVIVLAATNRPDVLDPALLRPGRFDRHVTLDLPDRKGREEVLKVHTRDVPLAADVDLSVVAAGTPGFSGADLKNVVNEAAMAAAREGAKAVTMQNFDEMRDKVMMGSVRTLAIQPEERHRLAVHESGHTIVAYHLPEADPIYKVTIIPRGRTLGGTHMMPEEERHTLPESYLKVRLALMLGGRTAEQQLLGGVSSGADDDIRQATQLARAMVARWGMAEEIGPVDLRQSEEHPFLGREIAQPRRFSETTAHEVDKAVGRLLREAEAIATEVITRHKNQMEALVAALEANETLDREAIEKCLGPSAKNKRQRDEAAA